MELSIDTSTRYAGVALSREGEVLVELTWRSERNHSVELLPAVEYLMRRQDVAMADISGIFLVKGPGGFSVLRVGMATAKGLAWTQNVPIVGVGTLEVEALPYMGMGLPVCALIGAGRGHIAAAVYTGSKADAELYEEVSPRICTLEELCSTIKEATIFCGEGLPEVASQVRELLGGRSLIMDANPPTRRPGLLAHIGSRRLQRGEVDNINTLEPLYLRQPSISVPKAR